MLKGLATHGGVRWDVSDGHWATVSVIVHGASDHVWAGSVSWADVGTLEGLLLPRLLGPAAGH